MSLYCVKNGVSKVVGHTGSLLLLSERRRETEKEAGDKKG